MKYLRDGWLILVLAIVFGASLAYINAALKPVIEANKKNETYNQLPAMILGAQNVDSSKTKVNGDIVEAFSADGKQAGKYRIFEQTVEGATGIYTVYICYKFENKTQQQLPCNYVIKAKGNGFADTIEALIGVDANVETVTGIYVLDQKETPGLGDKITSDWKNQYQGKKVQGKLTVVKGVKAEDCTDTQISAIGGATISSDSLTNIVNKAVAVFKEDLNKGKIGPGAKEAK